MTGKQTTLNQLGEMLSYVVEHMATKEDIANLRTSLIGIEGRLIRFGQRLTKIERELKKIRHTLQELNCKLDAMTSCAQTNFR